MSESVPTVRIDTPAGPTDINQADYDPAKHGPLHGAKPADPKVEKPKAAEKPKAD